MLFSCIEMASYWCSSHHVYSTADSLCTGFVCAGEICVWTTASESDQLVAMSGLAQHGHREPVSRVVWMEDQESRKLTHNVRHWEGWIPSASQLPHIHHSPSLLSTVPPPPLHPILSLSPPYLLSPFSHFTSLPSLSPPPPSITSPPSHLSPPLSPLISSHLSPPLLHLCPPSLADPIIRDGGEGVAMAVEQAGKKSAYSSRVSRHVSGCCPSPVTSSGGGA